MDPGFRTPIFAAEYNGETTQDYRYCTPDGLSILDCKGSCDLNFQTDIIYGTYSYYRKLSGSVGVGGNFGLPNASFSASIGFNSIKQLTEGNMNILTQSEAKCCSYTSEMFEFMKPKFHKNFIAGLASLTQDYNPAVYRRFIKAFGTHYVQKATLGATYGQQSTFNKESWSTLVEKGFNIGLSAGYSAIATVNISLNYNKTEAETFMRYASDQNTYSRGAVPPADGQPLTWAQSSFDNPNVLTTTLEPLDSLFLEEFVTPAVVQNLGKALKDYCPNLVEEGALDTCKAPPPDPPAPKPRTWTHWSNFQEGTVYKSQVSL